MNNQLNIYPEKRKTNCKKWICPFTGKEINTRGVPAYLRNKYNIQKWKKEYLTHPELLRRRKEEFTRFQLYRNVKEIFADLDFDELDILNANVIDQYFFLATRIRGALRANNKYKLRKIYKNLSNLTLKRSKILPKP